MATLSSSSNLRFCSQFFSPRPKQLHHRTLFTTRAADSEPPPPSESPAANDQEAAQDDFESRLSVVRLRYRSGTGKKAEIRKARKKGGSASSSAGGGGGGGGGIYLPPVPLKEAVSEGLKVELGFSPFSERINGRMAMLGLMALVLVELATGKGVIKYHSPAIVLTQVYFVAAAGAVFVKLEKEKVSVWPRE